SFAHHHDAISKNRLAPGNNGRRSAEKRMPTMSAHTGKRHRLPMLQARLRATVEGAPAFRRFTAALTTGYHPDGSAPEPGFLKTRRARCFARSPQCALS